MALHHTSIVNKSERRKAVPVLPMTENRILESYRYGQKLSGIYARKFPSLARERVCDIALDLSLKYKDWVDKPNCVLTTAMSREMFFKCCDAVKRLRIETKYYRPEKLINEEKHLHFQELSPDAKELLELLKEIGSDNWDVIAQELRNYNWSYRKAKNRCNELRRKYIGSSDLSRRDLFIQTVKPGKNGKFYSKQKKGGFYADNRGAWPLPKCQYFTEKPTAFRENNV